MEVSDGELEAALSSSTNAREYLIKLLELVDPDMVKHLQACLEEGACHGEQSFSVEDCSVEFEPTVDSECQYLTDQLTSTKIDLWSSCPPDPGFNCDEVSYCLLHLARMVRP
ncbi:unnamed protein product [Rodentolepis nana]|nr:unnamed protein product [Rodentolepis nana]